MKIDEEIFYMLLFGNVAATCFVIAISYLICPDVTDLHRMAVGLGVFFGLYILEFLCWLLHVPERVRKGIRHIHNNTKPKE